MKIFLLGILILIFPTIVFAQEINFLQESYLPKETLQAEILVPNIISIILPRDILITDSSNNIIKIGFFLKKLSDEYYFLYFNLPEDIQDGFYNLEIKNILYKENNLLKETSISNKFQINSSIQRDLFTIQPAILEFGSKTPYINLIVENKESKTITIPINVSDKSIQTSLSQLIIPSNSQKSINVFLSEMKGTKEYFYMGHYKIPIWILEGIPIATSKEIFSFSIIENNKEILLDELIAELNQNQIAYENIYIKNLLNESIYNLSVSLTSDLKLIIELNTTFIQKIKPNEILSEYLLINKERNPKYETYSGKLLLKSETYNIEFPITLNLIKEEIKEELPEEKEKIEQIKLANETKPFEKGLSENIEEKSPLSFILAIIGIILILIIVYFIIPKKKT